MFSLGGVGGGAQDEPLTGRKVRRQQTPDQDTSQNPSTGQSAASPAAKHEDRSSDSANKDTPNDLDESFQERGVEEGGDRGRGSRGAEGTGERYNDPPARPGPEASPHPVPPHPQQRAYRSSAAPGGPGSGWAAPAPRHRHRVTAARFPLQDPGESPGGDQKVGPMTNSSDASETPVFPPEQLKGPDRQGRQRSVQALVKL